MLIIGLILSIFFILVIVLLCRTYTKDIFELENRILGLEKREVHDVYLLKKQIAEVEQRKEEQMACKGKRKR